MEFTVADLKLIISVVVWIATIIGNSLPLWITAPKLAARAESLAGGVFIGAGIAHLLVDACLQLQQYTYPTAAAVACGTFVLLTFVEMFTYSEHDANVFGNRSEQEAELAVFDSDSPTQSTDSNYTPRDTELFGKNNLNFSGATISLYIIMSIHSVIEGIALGILQKWSTAIALSCAIIGHKPVEAFALSLVIFKVKPTQFVFWTLTVIYSLMTPVAIIASVFIAKNINPTAEGFIGAFSAGTFLFVGCHQWSGMVEQKQQQSTREKAWHFSMFAIGVVWMLLIAIIETVIT